MTEVVIEAVEGAPGLPWGLVALFVAAALDAVLPLVPSESSVISAGVLAVGGETSLPLVILAAAGDHVSYSSAARPVAAWAGRPAPAAAGAPRCGGRAGHSPSAAARSSSCAASSRARAPP